MGVRKGAFFSVDAMLSIGFLLIGIWLLSLLTYSLNTPSTEYNELNILSYDVLAVLEYMTVSESRNLSSINYYLNEGVIKEDDLDKTIIDLIGYFYLINETVIAENITKEVVDYYLPDSVGYELIIGNGTEQAVLAGSNKTFLRTMVVSKTLISGYALNKTVKGYVSRASLSKGWRTDSEYAYFGGYVGEGNISKYLFLPPNLDGVLSSSMEAEIGSGFKLYVNGNYSGTYQKTETNMSADYWEISSSYFKPGLNVINMEFLNQSRAYISGGYIKVDYNISELLVTGTEENLTETYWFPGIKGVINLYSSFYAPGSVNSMEVYLHYNSNFTVSLTLGNTTIYSTPSEGETNVILDDAYIQLKGLNYAEISNKTIPLRFMSENISYFLTGFGGTADSILVTDISGSMKDCADCTCACSYDCCSWGFQEEDWICPFSKTCESETCSGTECGSCWPKTARNHDCCCNNTKLDIAKDAGKEFIDVVLNATGNMVGLVAYNETTASTHDLSNDSASLYYEINSYDLGGGTCICCGIVSATNILILSNETRHRSMLVMSDGEANYRCNGHLNRKKAKTDAIQAACDAHELYNITVYTVGFGADADMDTLWEIAECGGGLAYEVTNLTELTSLYQIIGMNITNMSYVGQTIEAEGDVGLDNILYPDSYVKINYTRTAFTPEYGEITVKLEGPRFGGVVESPKQGYFLIPENSSPISARVISYSSNYWTDRLYFNKTGELVPVFKLWDYDADYRGLGDPYVIQIPPELLAPGSNSVLIDTGINETYTTGGSPDCKVIFETSLNVFVPYGEVFSKSLGSNKTVWYDSNQDGVADGSVQVLIGNNTDDEFDPGVDALDDAFLRLLDKLNFINDAGDDDGEQGNPIDIVVSEIEVQGTSVPEVSWLWGPTDFKMVVWI